MANEENLTPWKKGQSGNPKGKPKGTRNRSTIVRELLETKATDGEEGQIVDQLVLALVEKALNGDVPAARELFDSAYGKITDKVENRHSYTQMERVTVQNSQGNEKPLEFNVGSPPNSH